MQATNGKGEGGKGPGIVCDPGSELRLYLLCCRKETEKTGEKNKWDGKTHTNTRWQRIVDIYKPNTNSTSSLLGGGALVSSMYAGTRHMPVCVSVRG